MKKAIPLGVVNYETLKKLDYYVVDKSLMIRDFLVRKSTVTLVLRPRRFGKTLNISMMNAFLILPGHVIFVGLAHYRKEVMMEWKKSE